jgi:hypothetical protein
MTFAMRGHVTTSGYQILHRTSMNKYKHRGCEIAKCISRNGINVQIVCTDRFGDWMNACVKEKKTYRLQCLPVLRHWHATNEQKPSAYDFTPFHVFWWYFLGAALNTGWWKKMQSRVIVKSLHTALYSWYACIVHVLGQFKGFAAMQCILGQGNFDVEFCPV